MVRKRKVAKFGAKAGVWAAPKVGKAAGKAGKLAGKAALRAARSEAKLARHALSSQEAPKARYLKYGLAALAGLIVGALLARSRSEEETSFTTPAPSATGGRTWGSGTPLGTSAGGEHGVPEQKKDLENAIRTLIGQDSRTSELPHVNVEVNGEVAELRGSAPTEEAKAAAGELAASVEGIREVRNLISVAS